jgi:hypothetical protein
VRSKLARLDLLVQGVRDDRQIASQCVSVAVENVDASQLTILDLAELPHHHARASHGLLCARGPLGAGRFVWSLGQELVPFASRKVAGRCYAKTFTDGCTIVTP